ncbi:hypothetical protein HMPREF2141_01381 [Bacteroides uniformis]|nr:hypothetical protein HMPREF2141_01381 [Bacteroides uniformis]
MRAEIVIGEPFPELELPRKQYRAGIQQSRHFLYFVSGGGTIVHVTHDGRIVFLPPEWYYHPATGLHFIRPLVGQGVGEAAVQGQRQYDVGELFHRGDKDSGKWRENEMNGAFFMLRRGGGCCGFG